MSRFVCEDAAGGAYAKDGKIVAVVSGERPNLRNFWSGRWGSTWTIQLSGGQATISGDMKVSFCGDMKVHIGDDVTAMALFCEGARSLFRGR